MVVDCHVHLSATQPGRGHMSAKLLRSVPFKYLRWKFGLDPNGDGFDDSFQTVLIKQLAEAPSIDAAVVLAFDSVYDLDGARLDAHTHLMTCNDTVADLAKRDPKVLFGCSIHPYRKDAIAELERCVAAGAVLIKWLPVTQGIDPSHPKCYGFYDALAHFKLPLLSHTGGETMLPNLNRCTDPMLLMPALRRGVTVLAAHCGTRSFVGKDDYLKQFCRMALENENFYGDTAALNWPLRSYAYHTVLKDERLRAKLVHGSDWPVQPVPPMTLLGAHASLQLLEIRNWLERDVAIKRRLGLDDAFFRRAATLLKFPPGKCKTANGFPVPSLGTPGEG